MKLNNPILYTISSICGSVLLLSASKMTVGKFSNSQLLSKIIFLGKHTLFVLCTHMFLVESFRLLDYKLFNNILPRLDLFEGIVFGLILCLIEYITIRILENLKTKYSLSQV